MRSYLCYLAKHSHLVWHFENQQNLLNHSILFQYSLVWKRLETVKYVLNLGLSVRWLNGVGIDFIIIFQQNPWFKTNLELPLNIIYGPVYNLLEDQQEIIDVVNLWENLLLKTFIKNDEMCIKKIIIKTLLETQNDRCRSY